LAQYTDWSSILIDIGIDVPVDKVEFNIPCPLHNDSNPSCSINTEKAVWICHSGCGQGSLRTLYSLVSGKPLPLNAMIEKQESNIELLDLLDDVEDTSEDLVEINNPFEGRQPPEWIYDRGFTKETSNLWEFSISDQKSLVIPIKDRYNKFVGWVCRQPEGKLPKYIYSTGLKTSKVLFGENMIPDHMSELYIVEGTLDAIWLCQNGYNAVSLLGLNMSKDQEKALYRINTDSYIIALDNDNAGINAGNQIGSRLEKYGPIKYMNLGDMYKDVQDIRDKNKLQQELKNNSFIRSL